MQWLWRNHNQGRNMTPAPITLATGIAVGVVSMLLLAATFYLLARAGQPRTRPVDAPQPNATRPASDTSPETASGGEHDVRIR